MNQPVPTYQASDLERVLARDYSGGTPQARALVLTINMAPWKIDPLRVQMACLKLGSGDLSKLTAAINAAQQDWKDVLAWAEYSNYMNAVGPDAKQQAIEKDWHELQEWLHRGQAVAS